VLTTGNVLLPSCIIDLGCAAGYLRDISPLQRKPLARKILLADDSVTAQNMGRKILADAGYEVVTVNNGSAALKKIAEAKPDLIVLDVYMPGYSGLEVCQRLKEVQETSRIPVLLTVGKLEPFKPEEAKRVRAEGYIVKPFEASELLSALAKLEDKIVPRSEPSKPGRFARANAAIDEGRHDKSVVGGEDSGWKNRIAFPSKKKDKAAETEDGNEAAIYNPVNRDLRTVVEPKPARWQEATPEDDRVNVAALAPEGLPKDVTPEEIAALAAAAAQVKGKIADGMAAEPAPAPPVLVHEAHEALKIEAKTEVHAEAIPEAKEAAQPPATDAVTFASQKREGTKEEKKEEKIEAPTATSSESAPEASLPVPSPADVMAAIADLESSAAVSPSTSSGNGLGSHSTAERPADEPVTMAVAAGAESAWISPRWSAVPAALAPDEVAISLEHEMQKAYAAFAAAETAHTEFVAKTPNIHTSVSEPVPAETSSQVEAAAEPVVPAPATPTPEVAQAMNAMASATTEAISAAVKELEAVAASYEGPPQVSSESGHSQAAEPAAPSEPEASHAAEAKAEEASASEPAYAKPESPEMLAEEAMHEEQEHEEQEHEEQKHEEPAAVAARASEAASATTEAISRTPSQELPAQQISASQVSTEPAAPTADTGKKESEIAATTAAAWASWRRVRETGDPAPAPPAEPAKEDPQDAAAMAVAAGAENAPEESSDSDPSAIASIVDSVLADLRPKIFEEISRKMGKKK
jgi:two-component system chemotaxis response regulator CheY